jgi:Rap1a immunity proteins
MTAGQAVDVVRKMLREHPERRHYAATELVASALAQAFPCEHQHGRRAAFLRWFVCFVPTWLLLTTSQSAIADAWQGHRATLQDARIACRDIGSDSCLPYLAQAVALGDTLSDQANYDPKRDKFESLGGGGSV